MKHHHHHDEDGGADDAAADKWNARERRRVRKARRHGRRLAREWIDVFVRIIELGPEGRDAFDRTLDGLGGWIAQATGDDAGETKRRGGGGEGRGGIHPN